MEGPIKQRAVIAMLLAGCLGGCGTDDLTFLTDPVRSIPIPDAGDTGADGVAEDVTGEPDAPSVTRRPESELAPLRESCGFERGALGHETIGEEYPIGEAIPIQHFIVLMQENRSFDHYLGTLPGVDGLPEGTALPDGAGGSVTPFHQTEYCFRDVAHSWNASHRQYNDGANDGFVTTNNPEGERSLGYFDDSDIGFYWDLYSTFAMSDHHHCSVLGPTWINRMYFVSGTSFGLIGNDPVPPARLRDAPFSVYQTLEDAGHQWRVYSDEAAFVLGAFPVYGLSRSERLFPIEDFFVDIAEADEAFPPVVWIDPGFTGGGDRTDEHPPGDLQVGQRFVADVIEAVMDSPIWADTAIILTYDEHGGFYDHVPPPEACHPGDLPPDLSESSEPGDFDRLGFRVPLVVVSPYARAGYVSERVTDLTSVLRLIEVRFDLPALTGRDANAWPLLDLFDFENPPFMEPPELVEAVVDEEVLAECRERFPSRL